MGLTDFITQRFYDKIDFYPTYMNTFTSRATMNSKTPPVLPNTEQALATALNTCMPREDGPRVVYIRDTLELGDIFISEACIPLVEENERLEVISKPEPLPFADDGYLISPF